MQVKCHRIGGGWKPRGRRGDDPERRHRATGRIVPDWLAAASTAAPVVESIPSGKLLLSSRVLIESYSVLTRMPAPHRLSPRIAMELLSETLRDAATVIELPVDGRWRFLRDLIDDEAAGSAVYDAEIVATATRAGARRLSTLNVRDYKRCPSGPGDRERGMIRVNRTTRSLDGVDRGATRCCLGDDSEARDHVALVQLDEDLLPLYCPVPLSVAAPMPSGLWPSTSPEIGGPRPGAPVQASRAGATPLGRSFHWLRTPTFDEMSALAMVSRFA